MTKSSQELDNARAPASNRRTAALNRPIGAPPGNGEATSAGTSDLTDKAKASSGAGDNGANRRRTLPAAAVRALEEAEVRRDRQRQAERVRDGEIGGREGLEPTRYGDWEKNGIASDF